MPRKPRQTKAELKERNDLNSLLEQVGTDIAYAFFISKPKSINNIAPPTMGESYFFSQSEWTTCLDALASIYVDYTVLDGGQIQAYQVGDLARTILVNNNGWGRKMIDWAVNRAQNRWGKNT